MTDPLAKVRKAAVRAPVKFNAALHPGIVNRMSLMGRSPDEISAALGVSMATYTRWLEEYPEMAEARDAAEDADGVAVQSLHELVRGWRNPETGIRQPPNVAATIFWLKARQHWSDQPPPPRPVLKVEELAQDKMAKHIDDLVGAVDRTKALPAPKEDDDPF